MLQVHTLGCYSITDGVTFLHGDLGANGRRLSAYLFSFPNQLHRREKLVDMFWPDLAPDQARAAFSTALWRVRRLLTMVKMEGGPKVGAASAREILLEITDDRIVDAHSFRSNLKSALPSVGHEPDLELLEDSVSLYNGPFLDGEHDDWILAERERLECLYVRALSELMRLHSREKRYEDALACGRRILFVDPMRETIHRSVMLLYVLNGQRTEAIRQFHRCVRVLREECDVDPMPETQSIASMIHSGEVFDRLQELLQALYSRNM